jgi:hypothetical protein
MTAARQSGSLGVKFRVSRPQGPSLHRGITLEVAGATKRETELLRFPGLSRIIPAAAVIQGMLLDIAICEINNLKRQWTLGGGEQLRMDFGLPLSGSRLDWLNQRHPS